MKEKYKVIVETYESYDAEGYYYWKVEDYNGYEVRSGISKTPLIGFAEAMQAIDELKKQ